MFTLKHESGYNPYIIADGYVLKNIHFFNEKGIVISTGRGWFGNNNYLGTIDVPLELTRKLKPDFSLKNAFFIPIKRESYERDGKNAELYMPYDAFEWEVKKDGRWMDNTRNRRYYDVYVLKSYIIQHFKSYVEIEKFNREEELTGNIKFLDNVVPLFKLGGETPNEWTLLQNRDEIIIWIQEIAKQYKDFKVPRIQVE